MSRGGCRRNERRISEHRGWRINAPPAPHQRSLARHIAHFVWRAALLVACSGKIGQARSVCALRVSFSKKGGAHERMSKKAEEFFPEGCLVCMTHDDTGKQRRLVKEQFPGKVVGILKSSPNRDDVEVLVSMAMVQEIPSKTKPGKLDKQWAEGEIAKKKGKQLLTFVPQFAKVDNRLKPVDWKIEDLPFYLDENPRMPEVHKFIRNALAEMEIKSMPMDNMVRYMYPLDPPHNKLVWASWLQVKHDHYFYGTPDEIFCHVRHRK